MVPAQRCEGIAPSTLKKVADSVVGGKKDEAAVSRRRPVLMCASSG